MLAVVIGLFLIGWLCAGLGSAAARLLRLSPNGTDSWWLGLVATSWLALIWSLFARMDLWATGIFSVLALVGLAWGWRKARNLRLNTHFWYAWPFWAIGLLHAVSPPNHYDTGLYYLQTIQWIEEYPAVFGLANLHGRLGYNPNNLIFTALTDLHQLWGSGVFVLSFFAWSLSVGYFVQRIGALYAQTGISGSSAAHLFLLLMHSVFCVHLSSPTPDFIAFLIVLYTAARGYELAQRPETGMRDFIPLMLLSVYACTVKLAVVPLSVWMLWVMGRYRRETGALGAAVAMCAGLLLPWLARNVLLTGWLLFPMPALDVFDVDWKVPLEQVIYEKNLITGWARSRTLDSMEAAQMPRSVWLPIWWEAQHKTYKILLIVSLLGLVLSVFRWRAMDFFQRAMLLTAGLGLIFWGLMAPDFRFGRVWCWLCIALALWTWGGWRWWRNWAFLALIGFLSVWFARRSSYLYHPEQLAQRIWLPAPIQIEPDLVFKIFFINNTSVHVPQKGDRCFGFPLPCTPYPDSSVFPRGTNLRDGFRREATPR